MRLVCLPFLCLLSYSVGNPLAPGKAGKKWELICKPKQTIGGFWSHLTKVGGTRDIKISVFCRDIAEEITVEESNCDWAEPFVLGADVAISGNQNCQGKAYISGISGEWKKKKRMIKFKCCTPREADIDNAVGCHMTDPTNIFGLNVAGAKSPYEPRDKCPRYAFRGVEYCRTGLKLLFCPYSVKGKKYITRACRRRRTTDVELCPAQPYQDWELTCQLSQTIGGFYAKRIETRKGTDHKFTVFCRDLGGTRGFLDVTEDDCEWKESFYIAQGSQKFRSSNNCEEGEYASRIRSEWTGVKRKISLFCCQAGNSEIDPELGCHSTEPTPLLPEIHSGAKSPYEPRIGCPRYGWTGVSLCKGHVSVKFCAFRIDNVYYRDGVCQRIKTTGVEDCTVGEDDDDHSDDPDYGDGSDPPKGTYQCPIVPFGTCDKKECNDAYDCSGDSLCCWNGCRRVCFEKIPCIYTKNLGQGFCPTKCSIKCKEYVKSEVGIKRLRGWECHGKPEQECICKFRSNNPYCLEEDEIKTFEVIEADNDDDDDDYQATTADYAEYTEPDIESLLKGGLL